MSTQLNCMEKRLETLDKVEKKVDDFDKELKKLWVHITDQNTKITDKVTAVEDKSDNVALAVGLAQDKIQELESANEKLKSSLTDIEAQSMRNKLVFGGLEEDENESPTRTEAKLRQFLHEKLEMAQEQVDTLRFDSVHRMGAKFAANVNRKILANFSQFPQRESVRTRRGKLMGTPYFLHELYPKEIVEQRKKLVPKMKAAKRDGKSSWISYNVLYIDGKPVKNA